MIASSGFPSRSSSASSSGSPSVTSSRCPSGSAQVSRFRVDYAYVERNISIEVDGSATRSTKAELQRDRRRQNAIVLEQQLVLRFTWDDVTKDRTTWSRVVRRALGAGGGS